MINIHRMFYMAIIAVPVSFAHIIKFLFFVPLEKEEQGIWRNGIIFSHIVLTLTMLGVGLISSYLKRTVKQCNLFAYIFQYSIISLILIVGVAIVTIDQLVTPNITPFLVACTVTSLVFYIRPAVSVPMYLLTYILYHFSLRLTQTDEVILISNQVNGITAVGIGITLSMTLWQNNAKSFYQRERIEQQQKELEEKNSKLEYLAAYDSMTGLINRREFTRTINNELSRMHRHRYNSSILMTDIDFFKRINDKYGHPAGDELLKQFASLLKAHLRDMDVVARWGGEEFIILLPDTSIENSTATAERLRQVIEKNDFYIKDSGINITASFGVAKLLYSEQEPYSEHELFQKSYEGADKALYCAKNKGRNCTVVYAEGSID